MLTGDARQLGRKKIGKNLNKAEKKKNNSQQDFFLPLHRFNPIRRKRLERSSHTRVFVSVSVVISMGCKECRLVRTSKSIVYDSRQIAAVRRPSDRLNISIDEQIRRVHPRQKQLVADVDDYPDVSPNLDNLPVELLYYLFDHLDASTIVTSLYNVCQRLNTIVETYDQYHLNFKSISIDHFRQMCSILRPEQVVTLTLSDGNETVGLVKSFLKKFQLESFERLRTLNLINIGDSEQMTKICLGVQDRLQKLSIENHYGRYNETVIDVLLSIIGKPHLNSLVLDLGIARPWSFPSVWNTECSLRQIRLVGLCRLALLRNILISSPNLESFEASDIDFRGEWPGDDSDDDDFEQQHPTTIQDILYADRLKSLALISAHNEMKILEWFLPQFTELVHLKYINNNEYHLSSIFDADMAVFDGKRWEKLLERCEKFEFILGHHLQEDSLWSSHQSLSTFQTEFWQKKKWFTGLEEYENLVVIYSIPYAHHSNYYGKLKFISMPNNQSLLRKVMDNVTKLRVNMLAVKNLQKTVRFVPICLVSKRKNLFRSPARCVFLTFHN